MGHERPSGLTLKTDDSFEGMFVAESRHTVNGELIAFGHYGWRDVGTACGRRGAIEVHEEAVH